MTTFSVTFAVGDLQGSTFVEMEGLVDTGSTFTVVPRPILESLGIRPRRQASFSLGNGQVVLYDVGEARIRLAGMDGPAFCVFGEPNTEPLVGAVTLEGFLLGVDPVNETLIPVVGKLKPR